MGYRWTDTDKWDDKWFRTLSPNAKILFSLLCDKCNRVGVYEIDKPYMMFAIGLGEEELKEAVVMVRKAYVKSKDGKFIFLKNFLKNQRKLPLNNSNNEHKPIIAMLEKYSENEDLFKGEEAIERLLPVSNKPTIETPIEKPVEKKKRKSTKRFVKPTVEEIRDEMLAKGFDKKDEPEAFFDHYETNGWKAGRVPMSNWKYAVNKWVRNNKEGNTNNKFSIKKESKLDNVKESHKDTSEVNIDYNKIYSEKHG